MIKVKCFVKEESASHPGKWMIRPVYDNFHLDSTEGSFNLICARLMNLTYPQYLRMCRDCFGAEIIGKDSNYPVAYFKRGEELEGLIALLNMRANLVLWERDHPDYEAHAQYVKENSPIYYKAVTGNE